MLLPQVNWTELIQIPSYKHRTEYRYVRHTFEHIFLTESWKQNNKRPVTVAECIMPNSPVIQQILYCIVLLSIDLEKNARINQHSISPQASLKYQACTKAIAQDTTAIAVVPAVIVGAAAGTAAAAAMGAATGVAAPAVITANKQRPVTASGKRHLYKNLGFAGLKEQLKERLKPFWFGCCCSLITICWQVVILRSNMNINKYQWLAAEEQEHMFPELLPIPVVQPFQVTLPLPIRLPFPFSRRDTGPAGGTLGHDRQNRTCAWPAKIRQSLSNLFSFQKSSQKDPVNMSSASDSLGVSKVDPRFANAVASDGKNIGTSWATMVPNIGNLQKSTSKNMEFLPRIISLGFVWWIIYGERFASGRINPAVFQVQANTNANHKLTRLQLKSTNCFLGWILPTGPTSWLLPIDATPTNETCEMR